MVRHLRGPERDWVLIDRFTSNVYDLVMTASPTGSAPSRVRVNKTRVLERFEQLVGANSEHAVLVATRDVSERLYEDGLSTPTGPTMVTWRCASMKRIETSEARREPLLDRLST
jgi:hypothetical protein